MTHYDTLGVANTATPEEIKSAYRKLAKQHHPDLGGDVNQFQKISEAYETLADQDKKAHYDYSLRNPHQNFHNSVFNDPNDIFNHINKEFSHMFGFNFRHPQTPRNRNIRIQIDLDFLDTLDNIEKTIEYKLSSGATETITLTFTAGINDNTILQIQGRGDNTNTAVPRGALEVVVRVKPNNKFVRIDEHLMTEVTIDCFQAILGHELELDTPRGKKIVMKIPAGTQNGTQFGITDEGFSRPNKSRGKLIVKINVLIPTALTKDQIILVQQIVDLKPVNT